MTDLCSDTGLVAYSCELCGTPLLFGAPREGVRLGWVLCPSCSERQIVADSAAAAMEITLIIGDIDRLPVLRGREKTRVRGATRARLERLAGLLERRAKSRAE